MRLLVGLGNPGPKYERTRHNIGFMAVEQIARRHCFSPFSAKFQGLYTEKMWGDDKIALLKPKTYMNLSGQSVGECAHFYKIPPENIIVLHDELDLSLGKLRVKKGGGAGGHNGLKSLDAHIGSEYRRVRLGVAHPGDKDQVTDHVLSDFTKAEIEVVEKQLSMVAEHIGLLLQDDEAGFMNKVALGMSPAPEKKKEREKEIKSEQ